MHLVALYKGFVILQICMRVPDVGPDIFIQIPEIIIQILTVIVCQTLYNKYTEDDLLCIAAERYEHHREGLNNILIIG